jgi:Ser/Thr protein kinase RdoA (MazF antagonist)
MNNQFLVTHSILSVTALLDYLRLHYDVGPLGECRLLHRGLNDTFLVKAEHAKYIIRVYRSGWRSFSDINFELEALLHLQREGGSISTPLINKKGEYIGSVFAPEGQRFVVLFTHAPGKDLTYKKQEHQEHQAHQESYLYGRGVAQLHAASNTFQSSHNRFALGLGHLLDHPLQSIKPMLADRQEDWKYLIGLAAKLRQYVESKPPTALETGFCHGDLHSGNAHLDLDQALTFFDFDCCGIGWRSYDIAVFHWGTRLREKHQDLWQSFLRGYTEIRSLSEADIKAVPYFVAIRHIWLTGLHVSGGQDWGFGWMNDRYFDRQIAFLRKWEEEHLTGITKEPCEAQ